MPAKTIKPHRPMSISNKRTVIVFDHIVEKALSSVLNYVEFMDNFTSLDIFLRGFEGGMTSLVFVFDTLLNGKRMLSEINDILSKNNFPTINSVQILNDSGNINVSLFGLESSDEHETLIDALISQYHSDEIRNEYNSFYERLKTINRKPKNGKSQSYKNVLPALYSEQFSDEAFSALICSKYKTMLDTFNWS
ncbi:hypothetical protein [Sedimentibacter saalensis]|uniref:hypothetical protein n=1 Tax=Sedimentibacter saalensis TaxID=130788 RepID=UPI0028A26ED1|nr:hypothetical protein [Sedimentibacter saalensis]